MPHFAFKTLDGFLVEDDMPDVLPKALVIHRPIYSVGQYPPFTASRKYERTAETHNGLPLFQEVHS